MGLFFKKKGITYPRQLPIITFENHLQSLTHNISH
jgi:hypothetical protein